MEQLENGIVETLNLAHQAATEIASIVFAIGALVNRRSITLLPNGITSGLYDDEIVRFRDKLASLPRRLGFANARVMFVNDGWLVAMAHANVASPGETLALRGGTSLCGGIDDESVLGEIGWVGLRTTAGNLEEVGVSRQPILARDLLSAKALLAVHPDRRADHLASALHQLVSVISCFHSLSTIVLCGSLFTTVDHSTFRDSYLRISALSRSQSIGCEIEFSNLEDQRSLIVNGVINMNRIGPG
jgi:hypothetical protein